jgi:hypothetical protein
MSVTLRVCEEECKWDALVEKSSHGTIFHTWKFLKTVEKHSGSKLYPLVGYNGTEPVGLYPLFFQKRLFLRMVFSPPPHCTVHYLGPLLIEREEVKASKKELTFLEFQKATDDFIYKDLRANYVSIVTSPGVKDSRPFIWDDYEVKPLYNYQLDISADLEDTVRKSRKGLQWDIRKAEKNGVKIRVGGSEDLIKVYESNERRYQEQNKADLTKKEYVMELFSVLDPGRFVVLVAEQNGIYVGGIIMLCYNKKAIGWMGPSKPAIKGLAVNDLLVWELVKKFKSEGYSLYEEGGNTERLCDFKTKYDPFLEPYFSFKKYKSSYSRILETFYMKIFRPLIARKRER